MKLIKLKHDKKTKYHNFKVERRLDFSLIRDKSITTVVTFQNIVTNDGNAQEFIVHGASRFLYPNLGDVYFHNIQSDSPLYAHIFWDVLHQVEVGKFIYIEERNNLNRYIESDYFNDCFVAMDSDSKDIIVYKKIRPLIIELDRGLDEWTFGIPVGPEDPTFLNKCVERIIELDIPRKEIILCGRPHNDFKYFDHVKIVGEDIPAPPVHITKKKNTIVRNAKFKNLCIIHDRVMLPKTFYKAAQRFGDDFPFTGLQSLYFVDKKNLIPRKYSDFGTINENVSRAINVENITKTDLKFIGSRRLSYQCAMRSHHGCDYLTGSLYICKRSLWEYCPQNESLYWDDFEDVEHSLRSASLGIPNIINPYTITQSMNARSIIHHFGYFSINSYSGKIVQNRSLIEVIPFLKRKPLFRITKDEARRKLYNFSEKYSADDDVLFSILNNKLSGSARLKIICRIIDSIEIPIWKAGDFVKDFEKEVLCESMPPSFRQNLTDLLASSDSVHNKKRSLAGLPFLLNQVSHSLCQSPFMKDGDDWFIESSRFKSVCNKFSAVYLKFIMRGMFLDLTVSEIESAIDETTTYKKRG
ncbi:hypothetical protein [Serratia proteamaculans]